ncbi:MAG TPA: glycosyltransferase [Nitrospirales bacterium]|nr:glycosyltransferase [Nitrospirales bacterium]HIO69494.1 glycosyltransferase [Nitrospirales bacterium]
MRIMHTESSGGLGGQEFRTIAESESMARRGHDVLLVTQVGSRMECLARNAGLAVEPVHMNRWTLPSGVRKLYTLIGQFSPDIVHTHGSTDTWIAGIAARLSPRRPILIRTRHKATPISTGWLSRLLYEKLTDRIITTGETIRHAMHVRNGFDQTRMCSIPTGVDLHKLQSGSQDSHLREELSLPPDAVLVGMVGFLRFEKGAFYFVEAAKHLLQSVKNCWFCIAGDGPIEEKLRARICELGLENRVHLLGYRKDVPQILSALDVLVLPTTGGEGISQVILQALGLEKPVVATDTGGTKEVVVHGHTGLLVPPADALALAHSVERVIKNADTSKQMGINGRRLVEKSYSLDHMIEATERLYLTACSELRPSPLMTASVS